MRREPPATDLDYWLLKPSKRKGKSEMGEVQDDRHEPEKSGDFPTKFPKSPKLAELAKKAAQAAREYSELAELHSLLGLEPEVGSVLQFEHTYVNKANEFSKPYAYVAIRTEAGWCMSSTRATGRLWTWDRLVEFIGDEECFIATQWAQIGSD